MERLRRMAGKALLRPRTVLRVAVAFTAVAALVVVALPDRLQTAGFEDPGTESAQARHELGRSLGYDPEPGMVLVVRSTTPGADITAQLEEVDRRLKREPLVGQVDSTVAEDPNPLLTSNDGDTYLAVAHFKPAPEEQVAEAIDRIRSRPPPRGVTLRYGGYDVGLADGNRLAHQDLLRSELLALPLLALLLVLMFRGLRAALIPFGVGLVSLAGTFAFIELLSRFVDISVFALNLTSVLGLGLAIDYGLLLISRYREELASGATEEDALATTVDRAGRAVLFSGATVAAACAALLLFPQQFVYSIGLGGTFVALLSAASAYLVAPAALALFGRRVGVPAAASPASEGSWYATARWAMAHALPVAVVGGVVLLAAGLSGLRAKPTFLDESAAPRAIETREVLRTVRRDFTPNLAAPIELRVGGEGGELGPAAELGVKLDNSPRVRYASQPIGGPRGGGSLVYLIPRAPPLSDETQGLVRDIRKLRQPVLVTGRTADFVDLKDSLRARLPFAFLLLALGTMVLLFFLTRSVALPLKALMLNLAVLCAGLGALVLIFQDGFLGLADLIGYDGPNAIETTSAVVFSALVLGLSTDYTVLLLTRIKEERDGGAANEDAIAIGMEKTGPVISRAALLLVVALLAGAATRVFAVKQIAVAAAVAVTLDVTLVRALLVPSLMRLLGEWNWWAPEWLRRRR